MGEIQAAHSRWGASSYSRWSEKHGGCPGSIQMCQGLQSVESEYAKEGTLAHAHGAAILEKHFFDKPMPQLEPLDKAGMDAVQVYVDFVKEETLKCKRQDPAGELLIEHRFDLSAVAEGCFGTADAVIYFPEEKRLLVADYKHGAGISVDVEDNLQLQYYGLGALLSTGHPCDTVELAIIQPRCEHEDGPIRRWTFSSIQLLDFAADLADDVQSTKQQNAPLRPGKHCRFCPAAPTKCPAIKDKAQALAKLEFAPTLSYDPAQLDQALKFLPALESWIKQVREFAYGEAMHGRIPPGWKLVEKRGTRKWTVTDDVVVDYMMEATKREEHEFYEEPKLKSPAQMEKLVSKQIGEGLRKMMATVVSGYNLVPESDPRPAAKVDPKQQFDKIEGGDE